MAQKKEYQKLKRLAHVLTSIPDEKTMINFLKDLCTVDELTSMEGRWEVVEMLHAGKTYREIAKKTGVSTTTVTRVAQALKHGAGGYQAMLKK